jgi:hypothetical protein
MLVPGLFTELSLPRAKNVIFLPMLACWGNCLSICETSPLSKSIYLETDLTHCNMKFVSLVRGTLKQFCYIHYRVSLTMIEIEGVTSID